MSFASWHFARAASVSSMSFGLSSTSTMGRRSGIDTVLHSLAGYCECERGAGARRAFGANPAAMTLDDALGQRETDAGAFEVLHAMQALEHSEQLADVLHVEADAVVLDRVDALA